MTNSSMHPNVSSILETLAQDEQAESLQYLVEKLPELASSVQMIEDKMDFATAALNDHHSLRSTVNEIENKIEQLRFNEEHFNAIIDMMHLLPKFVPMMEQADRLMDFAQNVMEDEKTTQSFIDGINEVVPLKKGAEILEKTTEHFQQNEDTTPISIFGLMRMLKDPTVQHSLKYMQSLLYVVGKESTD